MLIQTVQLQKNSATQVALISLAVPGAFVGLVRGRSVPVDEILGDEATWVLGAHKSVHLIAIERRCLRAGAGLEMMAQPRSRGIKPVAEGALHIGTSMDARVQMLRAVL